MGYDGYITIGTKLDTSGIDANMSRLGKSLESKTAQMSNTMSKTFSLLRNTIVGLGIGAVVYGITRELDSAISRVDTLNNFANVMGNLGINAEDANKSINYLSDKLIGLPTKLDDAAQSVQRFTSVNGNLAASTEIFLAANNAILAGGASAQQQATAMYQLTDAYSRGKPDMMDWRSIMAAMPAQMNQVAQAMGYGAHGADALGQALRNGDVSMNQFMATMVKLNQEGVAGFKSFDEQARGATGGIATSIANLKTAISRGLATIIDTIGQSNIAGFISGIAKAINTASLYVAAFVKLIMTAINAIGALFGMKTAKKASNTQKDVKKSAVSMGGLSDSAGTASNNIGKAAGNAKKLKKELKQIASFDEMNVLSKNASNAGGSGGSGGSGGGGGTANLGDLSGIEIPTTEVESKADKINEIFEKMKEKIKLIFGDINFQPLADALKKVWDAAKPLAELTWDNLVWVWEHVLVPLAKWTIEDYLPTWLNNVASGLKIIKPVLEIVSDVAKDLYERVIKPIGQRVGGALVNALEQLQPYLESVGRWVRDHKPLIEDLFKVFINLNPLVLLLTLIEKITAGLEKLNDYLYENSDANKTVEGTQKRVNDMNRRLKSSQSDYTNAVRDARDAQKRLQEAEKESKTTGEILYAQIRDGKVSYKDLTEAQQDTLDAYLDLKDAEDKVNETEKKNKETKEMLKQASFDHADAILRETGDYGKYKKAVMEAYEEGRISAEDARNKIGVAMNGMSKDAKDKFTKDVPKAIRDGLDYDKQYKEKGNALKKDWKSKLLDKIDKKIVFTIAFPGYAAIKSAFKTNILDKLNDLAVIKVKTKSGTQTVKQGGRAKGGIFYPSQLPRLAIGGIVNMPGSGVPYNGAIIGERGAEAVVPLTDSQQMALLGEAIGKYITINANVVNTMNGRIISRELQRIQNDSNFEYNR